MEDYEQRRRQQNEDRSQRYRSAYGGGDRERDRESGREAWRDEEPPRRAERGWLDYDRDYDRPDTRDRRYENPRAEQSGRSERPSFSPDWSREGERGSWEQRSRSAVPSGPRQYAERSRPGDYYNPDWPYEGGERDRDEQRSRDEDRHSHYRGYYSRSAAPLSYPGGRGYVVSESWTLAGPYSGRGPKGYQRSDQQIIEEACQRLERDGEVDASEIEVTAENGVLTLRGTVPDRATKRRAEECVESVYGARDVMNELRVSGQSGQSGQSAQTSQASQKSASGEQSSTLARPGGAQSSSEQPEEDKRSPRH